MKVFIVDDSTIMQERLITLLSEIAAVEIVGQAYSALTAMAAIAHAQPDVIILDIQMTGGANGIEVLKEVKKQSAAPRVIMLTNYPYPQYRQQCLQAGADFFFDKSSEFNEVPKILKQWLQKSFGEA
ncbi:MAG: response regulator transcription factor [Acidobacteria bacterium]|nr:response regulator transcription factor [Acidobacteriota bacterium]